MNRQDAKDIKVLKEPDIDVDELAYQLIGAAIEVHKVLGPGFLESVYEEALCIELAKNDIAFTRQQPVTIEYKGHSIGEGRLDLTIENKIILELKAVEALAPIHTAQILSYLRATGYPLGLIINFNVPVLKDGIKRVILS